MLKHLGKYPPAPEVAVEDYTLDIGDRPPMVALDADVGFAASIMVQRAIYCLTQEESLAEAPSILLFGLRKGWIFKKPYEMIHVSARKDDWQCKQCWSGYPQNEDLSEKERAQYEEVMRSVQES